MAKSKVHQKTRAPKARVEQPVSEGIRRAAERAGIAPITLVTKPDGTQFCMFDRSVIEGLDAMLAYAAESAIEAAPHEIPPLRRNVGAQAAVDACRAIRKVRQAFRQAMEGAP